MTSISSQGPQAARAKDGGFALIEVIVALGIFLMIIAALTPQVVAGLRSITRSNDSTVLKAVAQGELDRLRSLPFRVSLGTAAVATPDPKVDLLDLYFPDTTAASTPSCAGPAGYSMPGVDGTWQGYVTSASSKCDYEPSPPFYRTTNVQTRAPLGTIAIVRDVQFLTAGTSSAPTAAPTAAPSLYKAADVTHNAPPTPQVGVTVTVLYNNEGRTKAYTVFTQIARRDDSTPVLRSSLDVSALQVSSKTPDGSIESLSAGAVNVVGLVADATTTTAALSSIAGRIATGDPITSLSGYGAGSTFAAPSSANVSTVTDNGSVSAGCQYVCWGHTSSGADGDGAAAVTADSGLPRAGAFDDQLRASLDGGEPSALWFDNVPPSGSYRADLGLDAAKHAVRLEGTSLMSSSLVPPSICPFNAPSSLRLSSSGYLTSDNQSDGDGRDTVTCGVSQAASVALLPTTADWAADGIVRVTLKGEYAWCGVSNDVADGGVGLDIAVQVSDGNGGYQAPLSLGSSFDPSSVTIPGHGSLAQYVSALTLDTGGVTKSGSHVTASVPGLRLVTTPLRSDAMDPTGLDQDSAIMLKVGSLSCESEVS